MGFFDPAFEFGFTSKDSALYLVSLGRAMHYLVETNIDELLAYPQVPMLYLSGALYEWNPPIHQDTKWQDALTTWQKRRGDCKAFTAWRIAELRIRGTFATFDISIVELPNGDARAHVFCRMPDGSIDDPSLRLGMR